MLTLEMMGALNRALEWWDVRHLDEVRDGDPVWGVRYLIRGTGTYGIFWGAVFIIPSGAISEMLHDEFKGRTLDAALCREVSEFIKETLTNP